MKYILYCTARRNVCVCVGGWGMGVRRIHYYVCILFWKFCVCIIVDLVKRGVLCFSVRYRALEMTVTVVMVTTMMMMMMMISLGHCFIEV